ncbi:MAG: outer membrane beta-barrel protein [Flammeovirgaceae bacterium]|nr:outer membrane beta-barrel protein [Flammeovirgaceae bacterium]
MAYSTSYKIATIDLSTYVRYNTNDIQSARNVRGDTIVSTVQNIGSEGNYGASVFLNLPFSKKFSLSGSADFTIVSWKKQFSRPIHQCPNQGLVQNYRLSGSYKFSRVLNSSSSSFFQGRNINLQGYRTNPTQP